MTAIDEAHAQECFGNWGWGSGALAPEARKQEYGEHGEAYCHACPKTKECLAALKTEVRLNNPDEVSEYNKAVGVFNLLGRDEVSAIIAMSYANNPDPYSKKIGENMSAGWQSRCVDEGWDPETGKERN